MNAGTRPLIMCVAADRGLLRALRDALRQALGPEVELITAERGDEALRLAQQLALDGAAIHVVLSELLLPGQRGDELLSALHQINPDTRGIALSHPGDRDALIRSVNLGRVEHILPLPWSAEGLEAAVADALSDYERRQGERGRLDLVEAATDAGLQLAAAADTSALAQRVVELAAGYTGAWAASLVRVNEAGVQLIAEAMPERSLFDGSGGAERLPLGLIRQLAETGGWRRHPGPDSASDWAREGLELPREGFGVRLVAHEGAAWVLVLEHPTRAFHRPAAPLLTRLAPWVSLLQGRLAAHEAEQAEQAAATARLSAELTATQQQAADTLSAHTAERDALTQELAAGSGRIEEQTLALASLQELAERTQADADEQARLAADTRARLERERDDLTRELDATRQSLAARDAELGVLRAQHEAQQQQATTAAESATQRLTALEAELAEVSQAKRQLLDDLARMGEQLGRAADSQAELKAELERERTAAEQRGAQHKAELDTLRRELEAPTAEARAELERQRLAHQEELTRQQRAHADAQQALTNERSELRNQILGLTAQLQGAGRPEGQESGPLREQLQSLAVKLADTEAQLEDAYRQAASAAVLRLPLALVRRHYPQAVGIVRPGRPYPQQTLWAGEAGEALVVATIAVGPEGAVHQLAWLEAELDRLLDASLALVGRLEPASWLSGLQRGWAAQFGPSASMQVGLAAFDAEAVVVRFASVGANLLLRRRGRLVPISAETAPADEPSGLLLAADDQFILVPERTLSPLDGAAMAALDAALDRLPPLPLIEQQQRLEALFASRARGAVEPGAAALYLRV